MGRAKRKLYNMKEGKRVEFKLTRHTVTLFLVTMLTFTLAFEDNFVVRSISILAFIVFVMGSFFCAYAHCIKSGR